ncbi:MAG: type II toxin-antitoxin system HicB family antitoxin [Patescibacteria group bacterium]
MKLTAVIKKEGRLFVAENPETGVASQGSTEGEALFNLQEAVSLYLSESNTVKLPKVTVKPLVV